MAERIETPRFVDSRAMLVSSLVRLLLVLYVGASAMFSPAVAARARRVHDLAVVGGTLVDVERRGRSANDRLVDIIVDGGRISAVRTATGRGAPRAARIVDARGKFILPGLIDGFGSMRSAKYAAAYLREGVTSVVVSEAVGGIDGEQTVLVPKEGPRVWLSRALDPPSVGASTPGAPPKRASGSKSLEIAREVNALGLSGASAITLGLRMQPDDVRSAIAAARRRGLPVLGEFGSTPYPEAIAAGASILFRNDRYLTSFASAAVRRAYASDPTGKAAPPAIRAACTVDPASQAVAAFAKLLARSGTYLMPILSIEATADDLGGPNPWTSAVASLFRPEDLDNPVDPVTNARPYLVEHADRRAELQACARRRQSIDGALHRAGASYLAGSGAPGFGIMPGAGLHEELKLLQQIGLSPREALASATSSIADAFALHGIGRVAQGKAADLLIVGRDPRLDVSAVDAVDVVILGGRVLAMPPVKSAAGRPRTHSLAVSSAG